MLAFFKTNIFKKTLSSLSVCVRACVRVCVLSCELYAPLSAMINFFLKKLYYSNFQIQYI